MLRFAAITGFRQIWTGASVPPRPHVMFGSGKFRSWITKTTWSPRVKTQQQVRRLLNRHHVCSICLVGELRSCVDSYSAVWGLRRPYAKTPSARPRTRCVKSTASNFSTPYSCIAATQAEQFYPHHATTPGDLRGVGARLADAALSLGRDEAARPFISGSQSSPRPSFSVMIGTLAGAKVTGFPGRLQTDDAEGNASSLSRVG
jgi:hypothetical protein